MSAAAGPRLKDKPNRSRSYSGDIGQLAGTALSTGANRVTLERVIGCCVSGNSCFAVSPATGELAYPAGCVVVVYSPRSNKQTRFLHHQQAKTKKPQKDLSPGEVPSGYSPSTSRTVSCLTYSSNGRWLAAGETGHRPRVVIWDLGGAPSTTRPPSPVSEFVAHKFAVSCLAFSPSSKYLVSVGHQHDCFLKVWEWRSGCLVASAKISAAIFGVTFSDDGSFFVTAGNRHLRFWNMDIIVNQKDSGSSAVNEGTTKQVASLEGRSASLGNHRDSVFTDVTSGKGSSSNTIYCTSYKGILHSFNSARQMEKWVDLRSPIFALAATERFVACACADGNVRLFQPISLQYIGTLPKPHPIGTDLLASNSEQTPQPIQPQPSATKYPDVIACRLSAESGKILCCYSDHSIFVWGVEDISKVYKYRDVSVTYPSEVPGSCDPLPPGTFITCSSDGTVRFWNVSGNCATKSVYSKEMLHSLYITEQNESLKAMKAPDVESRLLVDGSPATSAMAGGVRCLKRRPDGHHLAIGDRLGNLRIMDMKTLKVICTQAAHAAEILAMDYSLPSDTDTPFLLATASRDRLIHIFDAGKPSCNSPSYSLLITLDDHSSSITSVKFACFGSKLLSCSADKSIIFRNVEQNPISVTRYHHASVGQAKYDMGLDPLHKYLITSGHEKRLSLYSIANGKPVRSYKAEQDVADIIKLEIDHAGLHVITSSTDKSLRLYDFYSGDRIAIFSGHSEIVTSVKFLADCKRIVSVGGDSCIFIWSLAEDLSKAMQERLSETAKLKPQANFVQPTKLEAAIEQDTDIQEPPPARDSSSGESGLFNLGETGLPSWAKKTKVDVPETPEDQEERERIRGAWAKRAPIDQNTASENAEQAELSKKDSKLNVTVSDVNIALAATSTTPQPPIAPIPFLMPASPEAPQPINTVQLRSSEPTRTGLRHSDDITVIEEVEEQPPDDTTTAFSAKEDQALAGKKFEAKSAEPTNSEPPPSSATEENPTAEIYPEDDNGDYDSVLLHETYETLETPEVIDPDQRQSLSSTFLKNNPNGEPFHKDLEKTKERLRALGIIQKEMHAKPEDPPQSPPSPNRLSPRVTPSVPAIDPSRLSPRVAASSAPQPQSVENLAKLSPRVTPDLTDSANTLSSLKNSFVLSMNAYRLIKHYSETSNASVEHKKLECDFREMFTDMYKEIGGALGKDSTSSKQAEEAAVSKLLDKYSKLLVQRVEYHFQSIKDDRSTEESETEEVEEHQEEEMDS